MAQNRGEPSGSGPIPLAPDQRVDGVAARLRRVAPGARRGEQRLKQLAVEQMAGAQPMEMTDQRAAREIEVADRVEQLVADERGAVARAAPRGGGGAAACGR